MIQIEQNSEIDSQHQGLDSIMQNDQPDHTMTISTEKERWEKFYEERFLRSELYEPDPTTLELAPKDPNAPYTPISESDFRIEKNSFFDGNYIEADKTTNQLTLHMPDRSSFGSNYILGTKALIPLSDLSGDGDPTKITVEWDYEKLVNNMLDYMIHTNMTVTERVHGMEISEAQCETYLSQDKFYFANEDFLSAFIYPSWDFMDQAYEDFYLEKCGISQQDPNTHQFIVLSLGFR